MKTYKVVWEMELNAENPLEAAKTALKWIEESSDESGAHQFYVQDERGSLFSVDLDEYEEDAVLLVNEYLPLIDRIIGR